MIVKKLMIVKWIFEIALIIVLSLIYYANLPLSTAKVLYIPQGSIGKIIAYLQYKKMDISPVDGYLLRLVGMPQKGWIHIGTSRLTHADFLFKLSTAKAAMKEVTLIPGETTAIFLDQLSQTMELDAMALVEAYKKMTPIKEGALVPNTYKLPIGLGEKEAMRLLLNQSRRQMQTWSQKIFGTFNERKWFQYVTIASVIEKEAANSDEMPIISSVINNRLKKGMKLQMDGTLNYGKYSHIRVTAKRIRNDKSPYNTYRYKGLPPFPVCNVSFDAIKAAIFPAQTDYLYFVKSKDGTHRFTRYYSTHLRNIKGATK